ncbi:hydrolase, partial [Rhodococcus sp. IITR03]
MAAAAATACGDTVQEQRQPSAVGVVPGLERFYEQDVDWESCGPYGADGPMMVRQGVECARIEVPLDYEDPNGEVITLAVSRLPPVATGSVPCWSTPVAGRSGLSTALAADAPVLATAFRRVASTRGIGR